MTTSFIVILIFYLISSCEIIGNHLYNYGNTAIYVYVNGSYRTFAPANYNSPVYIGETVNTDIVRGYYNNKIVCSN